MRERFVSLNVSEDDFGTSLLSPDVRYSSRLAVAKIVWRSSDGAVRIQNRAGDYFYVPFIDLKVLVERIERDCWEDVSDRISIGELNDYKYNER